MSAYAAVCAFILCRASAKTTPPASRMHTNERTAPNAICGPLSIAYSARPGMANAAAMFVSAPATPSRATTPAAIHQITA